MRPSFFFLVSGLLVSLASSAQAQTFSSSTLSSPTFSSSFSLSSSTFATFAGKLLSRSSGLSSSPRAAADSFGVLKQSIVGDGLLWGLIALTIVLPAAATLVGLIGNLVASISGKGNLLRGWGLMGVITFSIGVIASTLFLAVNHSTADLLGIGLGLLGLALGGLVYSSINLAWGIRLGRAKVSFAPYVAPDASGRLQGGLVFRGTF